MFEEGSKTIRIAGGPVSFYDKYQTTILFVERPFGATVNTVTISNDSSTDTVVLSFNGAAVDGELSPNESITLNTKTRNEIYIRGTVGGGYVRIWGW